MGVRGGAEIHLQSREKPKLEQVDVPSGVNDPVGASAELAGKTCDPMGDPLRNSLFLKDCSLVEETHIGEEPGQLTPPDQRDIPDHMMSAQQ